MYVYSRGLVDATAGYLVDMGPPLVVVRTGVPASGSVAWWSSTVGAVPRATSNPPGLLPPSYTPMALQWSMQTGGT